MSSPAGQVTEKVGRVLVVEDETAVAEAIAEVVRTIGYAVRVAASGEEARRSVADSRPDLALVDQTLPDGEGTALLRELAALGVPDLVLVGASGSRDVVLEALRAGVSDVLRKPVKVSRLRRIVLGSPALQRRGPASAAVPAEAVEIRPAGLLGRSRASRELRRQVERLAGVDQLRALIVGPAGTDKRRVAARLHVETGANGTMVLVDCSHEIDSAAGVRFLGRAGDPERGVRPVRGYLARAHGGTLVLDDLSCLPRALQSVLCTALSTTPASAPSARAPSPAAPPARSGGGPGPDRQRRDDVDGGEDAAGRCVELHAGVVGLLREPARLALASGRLSSDLHLALSGAILELPTLEERREDIGEIAEHFLAELNGEEHGDKRLSEGLRVEIAERSWPGNLLQLRNTLKTAYARAEPHASLELGRNVAAAGEVARTPVEALVGMRFRDTRRELLQATLEHVGGDKRLCAKLLGISLKSVYTHLERSRRPERAATRAERPAASGQARRDAGSGRAKAQAPGAGPSRPGAPGR